MMLPCWCISAVAVLSMATVLRGIAGSWLAEYSSGLLPGLALATSVQSAVALKKLAEEGQEGGEQGEGEDEEEEEGESEDDESDMEEVTTRPPSPSAVNAQEPSVARPGTALA